MTTFNYTQDVLNDTNKYRPVDPGDYVWEIVSVTEAGSKSTPGNINTEVLCKLVGPATASQFFGVNNTIRLSSAEKAAVFVKDFIENALNDGKPMEAGKDYQLTTERLAGHKFWGTTENELYKGRKQNKISAYRPYKG